MHKVVRFTLTQYDLRHLANLDLKKSNKRQKTNSHTKLPLFDSDKIERGLSPDRSLTKKDVSKSKHSFKCYAWRSL